MVTVLILVQVSNHKTKLVLAPAKYVIIKKTTRTSDTELRHSLFDSGTTRLGRPHVLT